MDLIEATVRLEVAGAAPDGVEGLVATVVAPAGGALDPSADLVVCLPGGGMTRRYFDLRTPSGGTGYSMARHLAATGRVVAALDHPGVGDSDRPLDGYLLDPGTVADVDGVAVAALVRRLADGTVADDLGPVVPGRVVGCGHSMGGLLAVHLQARRHPFDALALLGFSGAGLPAALTEREAAFAGDREGAAAALVDLVRERFGRPASEGATGTSPFLVAVDVPDEALAAIASSAGTQLNLCGLWSMIPGVSAPELAAVEVPTFLGVGEHDITGEPRLVPSHLTGCRDLTLFVCPTCGHNHNVAPTRTLLWDRLARWLDEVA